MKWRILGITLAAAMIVGNESQAQTFLLMDDFSGLGGPLNNTIDDTGTARWQAGDTFLNDGTAGTTVAAGPSGQAAFLRFTPQAGYVYRASAIITNDQPNWIGFGFLPDLPVGSDWTATDFSVRHSNAPGYGWLLTRNSSGNDQEGFLGGGTSGGQPWNGDVTDPTNSIGFEIVLNTRPANWTIEWFINDESQGAPVAYGVTGNPGIGGIGFSHDRNATANSGGTLDSFILARMVPEPTSLALLGLGAAGLTAMRRRSRRTLT